MSPGCVLGVSRADIPPTRQIRHLERRQLTVCSYKSLGISEISLEDRICLEYKVVELEVDLPYPPDFEPYSESDDDEDDQQGRPMGRPHGVDSPFGRQPPQTQEAQEEARQERLKARLNEARRVLKNIKLEALRQCREFETTKLKELGEDGWTLQSIEPIHFPDHGIIDERGSLQKNESYTNLYYFSRPL